MQVKALTLDSADPYWAALVIEIVAVGIGTIAVGALMKGSLLLVRETRMAVKIMEERAAQAQVRFTILEEDTTDVFDLEA